MWKEVGEALGWRRPRAPSVRFLWDGRSTEAVLKFLRSTRVGSIGAERVPPEEEEGEESEGEEGGPPPPRLYFFLRLSFVPFPLGAKFLRGEAVSLVFPFVSALGAQEALL